ncbi:MAG: B12-binding domain-containing radical SAM protein [Elusimicrobiota bacterium]|nr:B12-binding domain-containing radical SAM protein [Elusimicrobiota bacterium]MDH5661992.1 B12-binding domain-containing radical SAM protein [Elusimicrobiota bacterium]
MRILLIQPPISSIDFAAGRLVLNEPLALEIIAACVPHHEVRILDMRLDDDLEREMVTFQPDIVATTSYTAGVYAALDILKKVKIYNQHILTVVGGHHATLMPQDFDREFIDVIVMGEGEITFPELIEAYEAQGDLGKVKGLALPQNGKLVFTPPREIMASLDVTPFPARHLTGKYRHRYFRGTWQPMASLYTSRGCPYRCDFCAMWKVSRGRYRVRDPERVVDELVDIEEEYIDIVDDNTLHDVRRAERMCQAIKGRGIRKKYKLYARSDTVVKHPEIIEKWREIGLELILIGFESFRDEELRAHKKQNSIQNNQEAIRILHAQGIEIAAYFLIDPAYTVSDFLALGDYVDRLNLTHPVFTILTPFPGTELFQKRYAELTNWNYELFDFCHSLLPTKLPIKIFHECLANLYWRCYGTDRNHEGRKPVVSRITGQQFYRGFREAYKDYGKISSFQF